MTNELVQKYFSDDSAQLEQSVAYGVRQNPDEFAKNYTKGQELGIAPDAAARLSETRDAEMASRLNKFGLGDLARKLPKTAKFYADPALAAMSWDDFDGVRAMEELSDKFRTDSLTPKQWQAVMMERSRVMQQRAVAAREEAQVPGYLKFLSPVTGVAQYGLEQMGVDVMGELHSMGAATLGGAGSAMTRAGAKLVGTVGAAVEAGAEALDIGDTLHDPQGSSKAKAILDDVNQSKFYQKALGASDYLTGLMGYGKKEAVAEYLTDDSGNTFKNPDYHMLGRGFVNQIEELPGTVVGFLAGGKLADALTGMEAGIATYDTAVQQQKGDDKMQAALKGLGVAGLNFVIFKAGGAPGPMSRTMPTEAAYDAGAQTLKEALVKPGIEAVKRGIGMSAGMTAGEELIANYNRLDKLDPVETLKRWGSSAVTMTGFELAHTIQPVLANISYMRATRDNVQRMKLHQRNIDAFRTMVENNTAPEEGQAPMEVLITKGELDTFCQSMGVRVPEVLGKKALNIEEQYASATPSTTLRIKFSDYITYTTQAPAELTLGLPARGGSDIAEGTDERPGLDQLVKFRDGDARPYDLQQAVKSRILLEQRWAERIGVSSQKPEIETPAYNKIKADFKEQLLKIYNDATAETYATWHASTMVNLAARFGLDAEKLHKDYGISVERLDRMVLAKGAADAKGTGQDVNGRSGEGFQQAPSRSDGRSRAGSDASIQRLLDGYAAATREGALAADADGVSLGGVEDAPPLQHPDNPGVRESYVGPVTGATFEAISLDNGGSLSEPHIYVHDSESGAFFTGTIRGNYLYGGEVRNGGLKGAGLDLYTAVGDYVNENYPQVSHYVARSTGTVENPDGIVKLTNSFHDAQWSGEGQLDRWAAIPIRSMADGPVAREENKRNDPREAQRVTADRAYAAAEEGLPGAPAPRSSWSYTRRSGGDDGAGGVRDVNGVPVRESWSLDPEHVAMLQRQGIQSPDIHELDPNDPLGPGVFREALAATKENNKYAASVHVYDESDYAGARLFMSEDGHAGFALKPDGDIISVFSHQTPTSKGAVHTMLEIAKLCGGSKLDCYDTVLPDVYNEHGFGVAARLEWDDAYKPEGWNYETFAKFNGGRPDVVFMALDPTGEQYAPGQGTKVSNYDEGTQLQRVMQILGGADIATEEVYNQPLSTRVPSGKKSTEDYMAELLITNLESAAMDPESFAKNVEKLASAVNFNIDPKLPVERKAEIILDHMKANLLWLFGQLSPDVQEHAKKWYVGARAISEKWGEKYGLSEAQVAGILATQSPQKDWFQNVSLAQRIVDIMETKQDFMWSPEMEKYAAGDGAIAQEGVDGDEGADAFKPEDLARVRNKTLGELESSYDQAIWLRAYDEAHNPRNYRMIHPDGTFGDFIKNKNGKTLTKVAWAGFKGIAKSIEIYRDGSKSVISKNLGSEHKVRNFYNNIFAPHSDKFVTIDTHAVAAALMRPLAGSSREVRDNLGGGSGSKMSGIKGTYGIVAEAYFRAAAEMGILPREMQSVTWEAIRTIMPADFKAEQLAGPSIVKGMLKKVKDGKVVRKMGRAMTFADVAAHVIPQITDPKLVAEWQKLTQRKRYNEDVVNDLVKRTEPYLIGTVDQTWQKHQRGEATVEETRDAVAAIAQEWRTKHGAADEPSWVGYEDNATDSESTYFQPKGEPAPAFYSGLLRAIPEMRVIADKTGMVDVKQAIAWLDARSRDRKFKDATAQVKREELESTGILDFLEATTDQKVGLDTIESIVRNGGFKITTTELGAPVYYTPTPFGDLGESTNKDEAQRAFEEFKDKHADAKYEVVQDDENTLRLYVGGLHVATADEMANGTWLVEPMGPGFMRKVSNIYAAHAALKEIGDKAVNDLRLSIQRGVQTKAGEDTEYHTYKEAGGEDYRELLIKIPHPTRQPDGTYGFGEETRGFVNREDALAESEGAPVTEDRSEPFSFRGPHWSENNVIGHLRFQTRILPDGTRVMDIDEVQSDWAQLGRAKGFTREFAKLSQEARELKAKINEMKDNGEQVPDELNEKYRRMKDRLQSIKPTGTYVGDSKAWTRVVLKQALRYAVENGFDTISFAGPKTHSDRWGSTRVEWARLEDGSFGVRIDNEKGPLDIAELMKPIPGVAMETIENVDQLAMELHAYLPETANADDVAAKLWKRMEKEESGVSLPRAEGFEGYYGDKGILHQVAREVLGKNVSKIQIDVAEEMFNVLDQNDQILHANLPEVRARYYAENHDAEGWWYEPSEGKRIPKLSDRVVYKIDEATADRVLNVGQTYFQPQQMDDSRGQIKFGRDNKLSITLFENADLSSLTHELSHAYFKIYRDLVSSQDAPVAEREAYTKLLGWLGAKHGEKLSTAQIEKMARAEEAWIHSGATPSADLAPVFARMSSWMKQVYGHVAYGNLQDENGQPLKVDISPEVRDFFERLHASDKAIEEMNDYRPLFTKPEDMGLPKREFDAYMKMAGKVVETAKRELEMKLIKQGERRHKAWWKAEEEKVRQEVTPEIDNLPVMRTLKALTDGFVTLPDGGELMVKLSRPAMVELLGEQGVKDLSAKVKLRMDNSGGHPDAIAELLGFSSGAAMLEAIKDAPKRNDLIREAVAKEMAKRHGDMMLDGTMTDAAMEVLHGEDRAKVMHEEMAILEAMRRKAKPAVDVEREAHRENVRDLEGLAREQRRMAENERRVQARIDKAEIAEARAAIPPVTETKAKAYEDVAMMPTRSLDPNSHLTASRRASKASFDAALRNDYEAAVAAQQEAIVQHFRYKAALEQREYATQVALDGRTMQTKPKQAVLGRADSAMGNPEGTGFRVQMQNLTESYGFAPISAEQAQKNQSISQWADEMLRRGEMPSIDPKVLAEAKKINYKDLNHHELVAVHEAMTNIYHLAKRAAQSDLMDRKQSFAEEVQLAVDTPLKRKFKDQISGSEETYDSALRSADAFMLRMVAIVDKLDGGDVNGVWRRNMLDPLRNATAEWHGLTAEYTQKLGEALELPKSIRKTMLDKVKLKDGLELTRKQIIGIALNCGNADNFKMITNAEAGNFTTEQVNDALKQLTVEEAKLVQNVWGVLESLRPRIGELEKRMTGLEPKWVPKTSITFKNNAGETISWEGGYYPLVADKRGTRGNRNDLPAGHIIEDGYVGIGTIHGFTKDRTGAQYQLDLRWDANTMGHIANVIKDLAYRQAITHVNRFISNVDVRKTVRETLGPQYEAQLTPWLRAVVNDQNSASIQGMNTFDKVFNYSRRAAVNMIIGYKVSSAFVQFTDYTRSFSMVRTDHMIKGMMQSLMSPKETQAFVARNSKLMKHRIDNLDRDMREKMTEALGQNTIKSMAEKHAFMLYGFMDRLVSTPTWIGAYNQHLAASGSHDQAVREADRVVELALQSGEAMDLAAVQRNHSVTKLVTMFAGDATATYTLLRHLGINAKSFGAAVHLASAAVLTLGVANVLADMLSGRGPEEDEDPVAYYGRIAALAPFRLVPGLRDVVSAYEAKAMGRPVDYRWSPLFSAAEKTANSLYNMGANYDVLTLEDWAYDSSTVVGYVFGIPGGTQVQNMARYANGVANEEIEDPSVLGFVRGDRK